MKNYEFFLAEKYGFKYPEGYEYLTHLKTEFGELRWWLVGLSEGLFDIGYELVNHDLESDIELFPFAKSSETNALACFDKEGKVYFVVGSNSLRGVDWSKRLTLPNFNSWLAGVKSGEF